MYPFKLFVHTWIEKVKEDFEKYGDGTLSTKFQLQDCDVFIGSAINNPSIMLVSQELKKAFFEAKVSDFKKKSKIFDGVKRILGNGIFFSQDN